MKPFDLEAANRGEPLVNRDGKKIDFFVFDSGADEGCKVLARNEGTRCVMAYYSDGRINRSSESGFDLFMAPKKITLYVNAYRRSDNGTVVVYAYDSEKAADRYASSELRIGGKAYRMEIEE